MYEYTLFNLWKRVYANIRFLSLPQFNFTVYFLAYVKDPSAVPTSGEEQWLFACRTPGCIELTWNYGSESEGPDRIYNTGRPDAFKEVSICSRCLEL